jgi:hypothetical protein
MELIFTILFFAVYGTAAGISGHTITYYCTADVRKSRVAAVIAIAAFLFPFLFHYL